MKFIIRKTKYIYIYILLLLISIFIYTYLHGIYIYTIPDAISFFILFNKFKALTAVSLSKSGNGDSTDSLQEYINSLIEHIPCSLSVYRKY